MNDYIFKVMLADNRVRYYTLEAKNITAARKRFEKASKKLDKGWCLLRVYRGV